MSQMFKSIIQIIHDKKLKISSVMEVGGFNVQYSVGCMFAMSYPDVDVAIVEPQARYAAQLIEALSRIGSINNSIVYPLAVSREEGAVHFMIPKHEGDGQSSAYVKGNKCSYLHRGKFSERDTTEILVPACRFCRIDDGKIDILLIDVEGSEWDVIQDIKSRPALIIVELYCSPPKEFINANFDKIIEWMKTNGYSTVKIEEPDLYFLKNEYVEPEEIIDVYAYVDSTRQG